MSELESGVESGARTACVSGELIYTEHSVCGALRGVKFCDFQEHVHSLYTMHTIYTMRIYSVLKGGNPNHTINVTVT